MNSKEYDKLIQIFHSNGVFVNKDDGDLTLKMDSLNFLSIAIDLEKEFNISVDENDELLLLGSSEPTLNEFIKCLDTYLT